MTTLLIFLLLLGFALTLGALVRMNSALLSQRDVIATLNETLQALQKSQQEVRVVERLLPVYQALSQAGEHELMTEILTRDPVLPVDHMLLWLLNEATTDLTICVTVSSAVNKTTATQAAVFLSQTVGRPVVTTAHTVGQQRFYAFRLQSPLTSEEESFYFDD